MPCIISRQPKGRLTSPVIGFPLRTGITVTVTRAGAGLEIPAIRELLELAACPKNSCAKVDALAHLHLQAIVRRINRLNALKRELESMIKSCAKGRIEDCRILDVLSSD